MTFLVIKKLIPELLLLILACIVSLYLLKHPIKKTLLKSHLPSIEVLDLPEVKLEEEMTTIPKGSLTNPFLSEVFLKAHTGQIPHQEKERTGHVLSMILLGKEKTCIINGQGVKEGEEVIKGVRVTKILPNGVWIEDNGKEIFIPLKLY